MAGFVRGTRITPHRHPGLCAGIQGLRNDWWGDSWIPDRRCRLSGMTGKENFPNILNRLLDSVARLGIFAAFRAIGHPVARAVFLIG